MALGEGLTLMASRETVNGAFDYGAICEGIFRLYPNADKDAFVQTLVKAIDKNGQPLDRDSERVKRTFEGGNRGILLANMMAEDGENINQDVMNRIIKAMVDMVMQAEDGAEDKGNRSPSDYAEEYLIHGFEWAVSEMFSEGVYVPGSGENIFVNEPEDAIKLLGEVLKDRLPEDVTIEQVYEKLKNGKEISGSKEFAAESTDDFCRRFRAAISELLKEEGAEGMEALGEA